MLERLYATERAAAMRLAVLLVGSEAEAEEVVQDAFLAVSNRLDQLDRPAAYLRICVVNGCRSVLRRRRTADRHRAAIEAEHERRAIVESDLPAHLGRLRQALDQLNERQRTVVVLRYFLDLPDAEIAEIVGVRQPTVRTIARRSLTILREELS